MRFVPVCLAATLTLLANSARAADAPPAVAPPAATPTPSKATSGNAENSRANTASAPLDDGLDRSLAALAAADRGRVTLDLKHTDAQTVVDRLNALGIVPVRVDWNALARIGFDPDDALDFSAKDVSLLDALAILAQSVGSETERAVIDAAPGQIVVTTDMSARALRGTAIYDVADIATDPTLLGEVDGGGVTIAPAATHGVSDETLAERMTRLVDLITDHIDTNSWTANGGERSAISAEAARLVVTATPSTHRKVRDLLLNLRRESPVAALVEVTLYEVPRAALDDMSRAAATDAAELARLIEHRDDARRGWSPRVVARLGEEAKLKSERTGETDSCFVVARHDRIGRVLSVTIELHVERGPNRAEFSGTLPFEGGRGAVATVLPGGPDDEHGWAVVVTAAECARPRE
ncbi:MAG: hypothetical protein U0572_12490 [Phycisphaerales bacterium]